MNESKIVSPDKLTQILKRWMMEHPRATQLDGSTKRESNPKAFCFVSFGGHAYRLHADTKREAIERFLFKCSELGSAELALRLDRSRTGKPCLRLNDGKFNSKGWNCYHDPRVSAQLHSSPAKAATQKKTVRAA